MEGQGRGASTTKKSEIKILTIFGSPTSIYGITLSTDIPVQISLKKILRKKKLLNNLAKFLFITSR